MSRTRRTIYLFLVLVALTWGVQGLRAAAGGGTAEKTAVSATTAAPAAPTAPAKAAAPAKASPQRRANSDGSPATAATAAAPQNGNGQGNGKNQGAKPCVINGVTHNPCPPGVLKQLNRQAARQNAAPQKKGVAVRLGGVSLATATKSPLAQVGTGPITLAAMTPGAAPDYFGVGNWANSALPQIANGAVVANTGIQKFVNSLPLLTSAGVNNLGTYIPLAVADTTTFPGSDFYRIGLKEYTHAFHSTLPATNVRGYFDMGNAADSANHYLGPLILATRNRPVRVLFTNQIGSDLNIPTDVTYNGAGAVDVGGGPVNASQRRATLHLHGGNTPWISDGTTMQWITPANDPLVQGAGAGLAKGFSSRNVPDMVPPGCNTLLNQCVIASPGFNDGQATFYWTNQQSGRLMFFHDHAYGITRLNVYAGEAAGYLLVDGVQEAGLRAATAPGTILTTNDPTGALDAFGNPSQIPNLATADLGHIIPLVIQDKSFVSDDGTALGSQLAAQDPTWDIGKWGSTGSLWFPHVYSPNQNPADTTGANGFGRYDWGPWFWPPQNPASLAAQAWPCTSVATPSTGWPLGPLNCPGVPFAGASTVPAAANAEVPDSPSGTPEAFMDTPVVNGTAYPFVQVAPAAYRFQVLNASNDRSLNLGLYVAEPVTISPIITAAGSGYSNPVVTVGGCNGAIATAQVGSGVDPVTLVPFTNGIVGINMVVQPSAACTPAITIADTAPGTGSGAQVSAVVSTLSDVHMVPAMSASSGRTVILPTLPNCGPQNPMAGGGQVTALLDAGGNPLNGTGMPAGCWPMYSSAEGYSAGPFGENGALSWGNSDGRTGGVPDPTFAGPPIIQIGAEGGVLPQPAVIPSTAVSYDYNKRSITVLNVLNHGLWLGPAERADVIVDFTGAQALCNLKGVNPCTLILYNDAPAPVPAGDPRSDYYTNDPDSSDSGGAPSTLAGFGPNIRTIMRIDVTGTNPNTTPFSLPTLTAAIPGIFAATQDHPIVPEPVYPVGFGNGPATYIPIQSTSVNAWIGGPIGPVTLTNGGANYTAPVTVSFIGGGGTLAAATATLAPTTVGSLTLTNGGSGYTSAPAVSISGGGGTGATATATLAATGSVKTLTLVSGGSGYTSAPTVTIAGGGGTGATATTTVQGGRVRTLTLTNGGTGYTTPLTITFNGGGGTGASATGTVGKAVASLTLTNPGSNYTSAPSVSFSGGGGSGAVASATLAGAVVAGITVTNGGTGYTSAPTVAISGGAGTGATATVAAPSTPLLPKTIQELFTLDYGRMNATLGVEVPFTNFLTQTTIPYGYADPPTEIFKDGETQLWKITHNGVDTHFIHFHLFTVQVINRVGWDGAIKPPDPYELGMKDTVRMNPLEDIIVALRPFKQALPFVVPNSVRPLDVTKPIGYTSTTTFTNVDPENNPATVVNDNVNFGWEYVWHCHILGHEENDMMRAMILAVAPAVPTVAAASGAARGSIVLTISAAATPTTAVPTGFTIQRATSAAGPWTTVGSVAATVVGTSATATFTNTGLTRGARYYYQVISNNLVGYTQVYAAPAVGYPNVSADSVPSSPPATALATR